MKELANGIHSFSVYRAYRVGETQLDYRLVPLDLNQSPMVLPLYCSECVCSRVATNSGFNYNITPSRH